MIYRYRMIGQFKVSNFISKKWDLYWKMSLVLQMMNNLFTQTFKYSNDAIFETFVMCDSFEKSITYQSLLKLFFVCAILMQSYHNVSPQRYLLVVTGLNTRSMCVGENPKQKYKTLSVYFNKKSLVYYLH